MKKLSFFLLLLLTLSVFQSCQKDTEEDPITQPAPELPAPESFIMPFDGFEDADTIRGPFQNWFHAASNVVVWNTILTVQLAVPVASFYASFNSDPEFQGNSTWLWAYDFNALGNTYQAELYGTLISTEEIQWEMYISQSGGFSGVLWYSGITAIDRSYANWTLNFNGNNPTPLLTADYERDNGNGVESIRYTNIIPDNPDNGSYIEYREDDLTDPYDRAYDVFLSGASNLLEIEWSSANKEGRVKDPKRFQDEEWHCWGTNLMDVVCN